MKRLTHERVNGIKTGYWSAATEPRERARQRPRPEWQSASPGPLETFSRSEVQHRQRKLYKLAERYQNKADTAYNAYQETGITRYDTACRNNEDLAEAIRAAAAASDEHNELVHLRGNMADLAGMAQRAKNSDEETKAMRLDVLMDSCISIGRLMGFLRREE